MIAQSAALDTLGHHPEEQLASIGAQVPTRFSNHFEFIILGGFQRFQSILVDFPRWKTATHVQELHSVAELLAKPHALASQFDGLAERW